MYNTIRIHPIGPFLCDFLADMPSPSEEGSTPMVHLSRIFWQRVFAPSCILGSLHTANRLGRVSRDTVEEIKFLIQQLPTVRSLLSQARDRPLGADETVFVFRILDRILRVYNSTSTTHHFSLSHGVTYLSDGYEERGIDFEIMMRQAPRYVDPEDFVGGIIRRTLEEYALRDAIVIIDLVFPSELAGVLGIGAYLWERGNTIVVDTNQEEQLNFANWIVPMRTTHRAIFDSIDYFIVYQDYGRGLAETLEVIRGVRETPPENVLYRDTDGTVTFHEPTTTDAEALRTQFLTFYDDSRWRFRMFGYDALYARLLPYRCYYGQCHFCVVNQINPFLPPPMRDTATFLGYIHGMLDLVERYDIQCLFLNDEAIHPVVIRAFATEILRRWLRISYLFRTRFHTEYTEELCRLIGESGARFVGVGLESINDRVNSTIANKGLAITRTEKQAIISRFDAAGVPFHNYSILGFPTETEAEMRETYDFLVENVDRNRYYTCMINGFSLIKGSHIHTHARDYGIVASTDTDAFGFGTAFEYENVQRNVAWVRQLTRQISIRQLCPWIDENNAFPVMPYWDFIDRTTIFYMMKVAYLDNPYVRYARINDAMLASDASDWSARYVRVSPWYRSIPQTGGMYSLADIVSGVSVIVDTATFAFVRDYDASRTFGDNGGDAIPIDHIRRLLVAKILLAAE